MYISFYVLDKASQTILFECPDDWRLQDFKYLGFEKDTDNILAISGDIGTCRYVYDGHTWKEQTDYDKEYVFDTVAKIFDSKFNSKNMILKKN